MLKRKIMLQLLTAGLMLLGLAGCGGGESIEPGKQLLTCNVPQVPNAAGTACVAPVPIKCPAPTVPDARNESCVIGVDPTAPAPSVFPAANQAVLYFKRPDGNYDGFKLHTWNNEACDSLLASSLAESWSNGLAISGVDANYGAYWILNLKDGIGAKATDCANFIIHKGTDDAGKELGGGDMKMPLGPKESVKFNRMGWTFSNVASVFAYPVVSLGVQISDSAAHWLDRNTFVWNGQTGGVAKVAVHHSAAADLAIDSDTKKLNGSAVEVIPTSLTDEQKARVPHLANWPAYKANLTADQAKAMVKNQLVLASFDSSGKIMAASYVQIQKVLDDLYTAGDKDANEASLGLSYDASNIKASLWAPTARSVSLKVYDASKTLVSSNAMTLDSATGIWAFTGSKATLDRKFYRFEVTVYHPLTKKVETIEATDPYSVNVSTNGRFSQFVNLADADTKPAGWDTHEVPVLKNPEDTTIYEGHIRDFSVRDTTVTPANRGKYLAFTEADSAPVKHLKDLAAAGMNTFHLLPATDMATVNEDASKRIDLDSTAGELCKLKPTSLACTASASTKLIDLLNSFQASGENAQSIVNDMRGFDSFNWGYDPHHFLTPEGSYASTPEGIARIKEMRAMNQALHGIGMRVVLDVVYNHTSSSGLFDNSVFDKVVPGYYHRYNPTTAGIERSTCCENTATENVMFAKFVKDSLVILARDYKFDGFRFDIMGHHPKAEILAARDAVRAVDADTYFYGEGWNFGEVANDARFVQARQANLNGTEIGSFNDRERDAVRNAALFLGDSDVGKLKDQNIIEIGLAGTLRNFVLKDYANNTGKASGINWNGQAAGYADDPADIINYVSKHDNESLWDKLQLGLPSSVSTDNRVRIHNIALAIPVLSQGIPFMQMGDDLLRSKSLDRNSYDSGDWFNRVDFSKQTNNWNVGLPLAQDNQGAWNTIKQIANNPSTTVYPEHIKFAGDVFREFLQIRKSSPLFRLTTGQDVIDRVGFHNIGKNLKQGLIVMSIDDGKGLTDLDPANDAIVVVINGTSTEQSHKVPTAQGFVVHDVQQKSVDNTVYSARFTAEGSDGRFTVPAYTIAVFVKPQQGAQGDGLKANATMGAPDVAPYGLTTVYVRGGINGWSTDNPLAYVGAGVYQTTITISNAGTQEFKIASSDWSTVDFGASGSADVTFGVAKALQRQGVNMKANFAAGKYVFTLNAVNPQAPTLTVSEFVPYGATKVFLRGSMNGWGETTQFAFTGGVYQVAVALNAGNYEFKFASADWSTVNYGAGSAGADVALGVNKPLAQSNDNLKIAISENGTYLFTVNADTPTAPVLKVVKQ